VGVTGEQESNNQSSTPSIEAAESILDNAFTRSEFTNDLYEV
jgi:hypothetical protein